MLFQTISKGFLITLRIQNQKNPPPADPIPTSISNVQYTGCDLFLTKNVRYTGRSIYWLQFLKIFKIGRKKIRRFAAILPEKKFRRSAAFVFNNTNSNL